MFELNLGLCFGLRSAVASTDGPAGSLLSTHTVATVTAVPCELVRNLVNTTASTTNQTDARRMQEPLSIPLTVTVRDPSEIKLHSLHSVTKLKIRIQSWFSQRDRTESGVCVCPPVWQLLSRCAVWTTGCSCMCEYCVCVCVHLWGRYCRVVWSRPQEVSV